MYRIKYDYRTGDSFGSEDCTDLLEFEWEDYKYAKESLNRIKEHYEWYKSKDSYFKDEKPKPEWHKVKLPDDMKDHEHYLINLRINDTEEVQFWCPWCGYFESLYGAEIVTDDKFSID